jgi:hypothetical protein
MAVSVPVNLGVPLPIPLPTFFLALDSLPSWSPQAGLTSEGKPCAAAGRARLE